MVEWPKKFDWDYVLHFLGGVGIGLVGISIPAWRLELEQGVILALSLALVVTVGTLGYFRERWQADWAPLGGRMHKWIEALTWPIGTSLVALGELLVNG